MKKKILFPVTIAVILTAVGGTFAYRNSKNVVDVYAVNTLQQMYWGNSNSYSGNVYEAQSQNVYVDSTQKIQELYVTLNQHVQAGDPLIRFDTDSVKLTLAMKNIELVGLKGSEHKHPAEFSGGMKQRVSIARALAADPDVLFMDEPFGALDAITRMKLQDDILRICKEENKTIIFVTHDIEESVYLADRIVILDNANKGIKSIVNINMPEDRDRTSDDFLAVRDNVFDIFKMKHEKRIEYYI